MTQSQILIIGASVRAAAESARRAGWQPLAIDCFGDLDLAEAAAVVPVVNYPRGIVAAAQQLSPMPWIYTGALENSPELIAAVSLRHRLLGNSAPALRDVRDPFVLARLGLPMPAAVPGNAAPPADRRWVSKPFRSGGGRRVRLWQAGDELPGETGFFQEHISGEAMSVVCLACRTEVTPLAMTRQLLSESPGRFEYRGSLAPIAVSPAVERQVRELAEALAEKTQLRGLIGCDVVVANDRLWLIEINPRYTASVELLERDGGLSLLPRHVLACCDEGGPSASVSAVLGLPLSQDVSRLSGVRLTAAPRMIQGKQIVFAPSQRRAKDFLRDGKELRELRAFADIPAAGQCFEPGDPICTVFASGPDEQTCLRELQQRARQTLQDLTEPC